MLKKWYIGLQNNLFGNNCNYISEICSRNLNK